MPSDKLMDEIIGYINNRVGLNQYGDIAVPYLSLCKEDTWKTMQLKAEAKCKAYRCLIYSKNIITPQLLQELEQLTSTRYESSRWAQGMSAAQKLFAADAAAELENSKQRVKNIEEFSIKGRKRKLKLMESEENNSSEVFIDSNGIDDESTVEAQVSSMDYPLLVYQKTPLRVLHRRSLLTRKRYISNIQTVYVNQHVFIMTLVTTAGTYVKELVHGDNNRTVPSISSLFLCPMHMLQLDVIYLFDDFHPCIPVREFDATCDELNIHWHKIPSSNSKDSIMPWISSRNHCSIRLRKSISNNAQSDVIDTAKVDQSCKSGLIMTHDELNKNFRDSVSGGYVTYELIPVPNRSTNLVIFNLTHTFVPKSARGQGIGSLLCEYAIDFALTQGYALWNHESFKESNAIMNTTCWFAKDVLTKYKSNN